MSYDLINAKKLLAEFLGADFKIYLKLLKSWFHKKLTKEDFDHKARNLLSSSSVFLHNNFLLALLSKCRNLTSSSIFSSKNVVKADKKVNIPLAVPNTGFFQCHLPVDVLSQVAQVRLQPIDQDHSNPEYLAMDIFLPSVDFVYGRIIVAAWEFGLDSINDKCSEILVEAIYIMLKNILTCLVKNSSPYQLYQNKFMHSFGAPYPDKFLEPQIYETEISISEDPVVIPTKRFRNEINCDILKNQVLKIDIFDLLNVFQKNKNVIQSHTVLTLNHERTLNRMCHPTKDELNKMQSIKTYKQIS